MSGDAKDSRGAPARDARLAAALRENLRRRKAQARGRTGTSSAEAEPAAPPRDTHER